MRFIIPAAALALLAFQAQAQTAAPATPAPAPMTGSDQAAPATPAPAAPAKATKAHVRRQSLQQRFDAANTSHDGHLTKDQAAAAKWTYVTRHFAQIDKTNQGFVTVDDIRGYAQSQHMHHHATPKQPQPSNG